MKLRESRPARRGRFCGVAAVDRVRCKESVRESAAATNPKTSRWGVGRRCPIREGPLCRGRGEAVGDYIFTAEPS